MSNDSNVVALRPDMPIQYDNKVVRLRPTLRIQDCIKFLQLAMLFGWQPFEVEGEFHADPVSLKEALDRAKAALLIDDWAKRHEKLKVGLVWGYPVAGIDTLGLRGAMIDFYRHAWERDELIKLFDELVRAEVLQEET